MKEQSLFITSTNAEKKVIYIKFVVVLFIAITFTPNFTHAQSLNDNITPKELVGLWQLNSATVGSGLNKNFRFYNDGKFLFTFGGSDYDGRLLNIGGHYKIDSNNLYFSVEYRTEVLGGKIAPGLDGVLGAEFVILDGETRVTKQAPSTENYPFRLTRCDDKPTKTMQCVKIEYKKYYKLSSNPDSHK